MTDEIIFPSVRWFEALADDMSAEEASFRELGPIDCTMVVKIDDDGVQELFEIEFEAYTVKSICRVEQLDVGRHSYFVIEAPMSAWREMIENIRANGAPDLEHTLNYLTFPDDPMRVVGPSQLEVDAFYRYNESLQRFFNGAAAVETVFAD